MRMNNLYRAELNAARRLFGWADRHQYVVNTILATGAIFTACWIFMNYPL